MEHKWKKTYTVGVCGSLREEIVNSAGFDVRWCEKNVSEAVAAVTSMWKCVIWAVLKLKSRLIAGVLNEFQFRTSLRCWMRKVWKNTIWRIQCESFCRAVVHMQPGKTEVLNNFDLDRNCENFEIILINVNHRKLASGWSKEKYI